MIQVGSSAGGAARPSLCEPTKTIKLQAPPISPPAVQGRQAVTRGGAPCRRRGVPGRDTENRKLCRHAAVRAGT